MANKTIPELNALTSVNSLALFPVDTGTQTFKVTFQNIYKSLRALPALRTVAVADNILNTDELVICNTGSGAFAVTMPTPATMPNQFVTIKNIGANTLTINAAANIDGASSITLVQWETATLLSASGTWFVI